MAINFTDFSRMPLEDSPFANLIESLVGGYKMGTLPAQLAQAAKKRQSEIELNEAQARYMPDILKAKLGLIGAQAGSAQASSGLKAAQSKMFRDLLSGGVAPRSQDSGGLNEPSGVSGDLLESGGGVLGSAVVPEGMDLDDWIKTHTESGDTRSRSVDSSSIPLEKALIASGLMKLPTHKFKDEAGNEMIQTAFGKYRLSKGLSPFEKSRTEALGKIPAKFYESAVNAYQGFQNQGVALDEIADAISGNPEFMNVTGPVGSKVSKWLGTPEQRELLGRLQSASGEIALQVAPALKGAFTGRDQSLINSIKASPADFPEVFIGKLRAQKLINNVLMDRAEKAAQYIEEGLSPIKSYRMATLETPLESYRDEVDRLIKRPMASQAIARNLGIDSSKKKDDGFIDRYVAPFNKFIEGNVSPLAGGLLEGTGQGIRNVANLIPGVNLPDVDFGRYIPSTTTGRIERAAGDILGQIMPFGALSKALGSVRGLSGSMPIHGLARGAIAGGATGGDSLESRLLGAILGGAQGFGSSITKPKIAEEVLGSKKIATEKAAEDYSELFKQSKDELVRRPSIKSDLIIKHSTKDYNSSLKNFLENPTVSNAHDAQSDLGKFISKLKKADKNVPLTASKVKALQAAEDAQKRLRGVVAMKLEENTPGAATQYGKLTKEYAEKVIPYTRHPAIKDFELGKIDKKTMVSRLMKDEDFVRKVAKENPAMKTRAEIERFLGTKLADVILKHGGWFAAGAVGADKFLR